MIFNMLNKKTKFDIILSMLKEGLKKEILFIKTLQFSNFSLK